MIRNNIKLAFRSIFRKQGYSITSIFGLAVGMTCCLAILFFVLDELSYDQYHVKKERIHRLVTAVTSGNSIAKVTGPWGVAAKAEIPEIEDMTRFVWAGQMLFSRGDKLLYENLGRYADSTTFNIFSFDLLEGDPRTALTAPNSIVLTQSLSKKYFGDEPALGGSIKLDNHEFNVTGILADVPLNSHFSFTYLLSMSSLQHPDKDDWLRWNQFYTYLLLRDGASPESVASKMKVVLQKNLEPETAASYDPFLQPLTSIHLYSHLFREMNPNSDVMYIYIFSSIALLILLISCANFVNLATALGATRAKEIGVRKVNGAYRRQLIGQFITEAFITSMLSLLLAQLMTSAILPAVNELTGKNLTLNYIQQPMALAGIILVAILTALLAGGYSAFYLSSLKPVQVIKGKWSPKGGAVVRKGLVTFQFMLSSLLIIGSIIIQQQLYFINTRSLGFDPQQVVTIPIQADALRTNYETVRKELEALPGVVSVSASGNQPGGSDWGIPSLAEGFTNDNMPAMRVMAVDPGFIRTFGMEVVNGRGFSADLASDSSAYLINEEGARQLGWTDPLTKTISMPAVNRPGGPVIGVVKDFHFRSLREKIGPLLFFMPPAGWYSQYSIKIDAADTQAILKSIEDKWSQFDPEHPFTFSFFDEGYSQLYQQENRLATIVNYFTFIGIFLSCLGLYSLASLTTEQRTKEIGIRKAIGATSRQIVMMLSKQYLTLVIAGFVVALPAALWMSDKWLQSFAYRDDFNVLLIAAGCGLSVMVALLTVGYRAWRAARINPVVSLRNE
jgi:putative ABC transport system permease protein